MPYRFLLAAVVGIGALALPAGAQAYDICVAPVTGCAAEHTHATLELALNDADDLPAEKDTIKLGAATYTRETAGSGFVANSLVDIVGAGVGKTIIEAPSNVSQGTLNLDKAGSSASDLTIRFANGSLYAVLLRSSSIQRFEITAPADRPPNPGQNGRAVVFNNDLAGPNLIKDGTISLPLGAPHNEWGVWAARDGTIENMTITGDNAVVNNSGADIFVKRSTLVGHRTYVIDGNGITNISDSLIRATPGSTNIALGLQNESHGLANTVMNVKNTTVIGPGTHPSLAASEGIKVGSWTDCDGGSATTNADGVTVTGFSRNSVQDGCGVAPSFPATCPGPAPGNAAQLQLTNYHREGGSVENPDGGCLGQSNVRGGPPNFVSADDLRPKFPSPLIDQGSTEAGEEKDLAGRPRVVEGDGAGSARRDIGAFEYQRQAPTVSASVNPASGPLSQLFTFSASGSDADGEAVTFIWDFTDGTTPLGATAEKTFKTLGTHSGTVQAQDTAGLVAKSTASVSVVDGTPPPPPPVVDTEAPLVTIKGGALPVNKKRKTKALITCPATETAPCQIAIAASSAKKIALSGSKKKISALGKGSGSVAPGKSAGVTITLTKKAYKYLKRKKRIPGKLAVTAKDAAGNSAKASAKVTFRR